MCWMYYFLFQMVLVNTLLSSYSAVLHLFAIYSDTLQIAQFSNTDIFEWASGL